MKILPPIHERTVSAAFRSALNECPNDRFLIYSDSSWSFKEVHENAMSYGSTVFSEVKERQKPVAILMDNKPEYVFTWLGIALQGLIEVPVNTALKGSLLAHVLNDSGAESIVVDAKYLSVLSDVEVELDTLKSVFVIDLDEATTRPAQLQLFNLRLDAVLGADSSCDNAADDVVAYMYTSGTTGPSKGVVTSHAQAYSFCADTYDSETDEYSLEDGDTIIVTLPLFHLAGQWGGVYAALINQKPCVLEPRFSVSRFWDSVNAHSATHTVMLGAQAELLQQHYRDYSRVENSLKVATMAPLPTNIEGFSQLFDVAARPVYGSSEVGSVLQSANPRNVRPGEAGMKRSMYELRIVDPDGQEVAEGAGGELLVRPNNPLLVTSGYHGLPDATRALIDDEGWVHTGDIFRRDPDGHYYFVDRVKDALRRMGENISSFEVEAAINEHSDVHESAVIGVDSELSEQEVMAFVVPKEGAQLLEIDLIRFLVDRLPYFMVPRFIEMVSSLPVTDTHKIRKSDLRARGVGAQTWDLHTTSLRVKRDGLITV